jgi:hypothetical protein
MNSHVDVPFIFSGNICTDFQPPKSPIDFYVQWNMSIRMCFCCNLMGIIKASFGSASI